MTHAISQHRMWMDGAFWEGDESILPLSDRGFTLGDGLFETMLWTGRDIRFFDAHMARLTHAAAALELAVPQSAIAIYDGLVGLAQAAPDQKASLRLTLTRGSGPRGLAIPETCEPRLIATIALYDAPTTPVHLSSVSIHRNSGAPSSRFKTLSYIDNIMALREARLLGGDDALMRGTTGNIACASSANVIVRDRGANLTPALEDGALPGIVRGHLIKAGLIEEARICPSGVATWEGAVLTNALIGVRTVSQINEHRFKRGQNWAARLAASLDMAT